MTNFLKNLDLNLILEEICEDIFSNSLKERKYDNFPFLSKDLVLSSFKEIEQTKNAILKLNLIFFAYNYDISKILEKVEKGYTLLENEIIMVYYEILVAKNIRTKLNELRKTDCDFFALEKLLEDVFPHSYVFDKISKTLDEYANFKTSASKTYKEIFNKINLLEEKISNVLETIKDKNLKILLNKNIHLKDNKKTLLVKSSFKNEIDGEIISSSNTDKGTFVEPSEVKKLNKEIASLNDDLKKEEEKLLKEITLLIKKDILTFYKNQELYKRLDLIYAKAKYAIKHNCNIVCISDEKEIILNNISHPLVKDAVKISFNFDKNKDIFLITGPNAGGKTACMKSVGLIICMAKLGLLLPCDSDSKIFLFENVFTDIGDNQSITQSLSTFSAHIKNINDIINSAREDDLVILDEIGSGTDPVEGSAIAMSILDFFIKNKIKLILTSHYPDLKRYVYNLNNSVCASVFFDTKTLKPMFFLNYDIIGSSNAILISEKLNLKKEIIDNAYKKLSTIKKTNNTELDKIFLKNEENKQEEIKLNNLKQELLEKEKEIFRFEKEYRIKLDKEYNTLKEELENNFEVEKEKLHEKIKLLEKNSNLPNIADAKSLLKTRLSTDIKSSILRVGDYVLCKNHNKKGIIESIKKDKYLVNLGNLSLEYYKDELILVEEPKKVFSPIKNKVRQNSNKDNFVTNIKTVSLDLRGKRYDEVADLVEKLISDCLLINQPLAKIITGHGSGAVRKATIEYLKNNKYVKKYRFGEIGEGLNGVIVIYF